MKVQDYMRLPYRVEVVPDVTTEGEPIFVARHPELSGCMAHGDSAEEAEMLLIDARSLYIGSLLEEGLEPPRPAEGPVERVVWTHAGAAAAAQTSVRQLVPGAYMAGSATRAYAEVDAVDYR